MNNIETVKHIYDAFGRGDVEAILNHLTDDVEWEYGASPSDIPWLQPRTGRMGAAAFFASLRDLDFRRFEVKGLFADDGRVVALVDLEAIVLSSGRTITEEDEVHIWHFDEAGRISRFRHRADTLQHQQALTGRPVAVN